jgi:hypothetical protein
MKYPSILVKPVRIDINRENMTTMDAHKSLYFLGGAPLTKKAAIGLGARSYVLFNTLLEQHAKMFEEELIRKHLTPFGVITLNNGTSGVSWYEIFDENGVAVKVYRVFVTIYHGAEILTSKLAS